jgi:4-amino-4-deoxy-L-arabinose transferase-like glycosyltransferase
LIAWSAAALAALTLLRLVLAARLPLAPDEAYYFLWSQHLQAGYFDHPPMVALWIRAGTLLAGDTKLGVRLLGPLAGACGSVLLWRAGEAFAPGRHVGLIAAALVNATVLVGVGSIVMTPDTPLFFFWTVGLAAAARLIVTGNPRWWLAIGAAAGLALLSKYTALLFVAGVGMWLLSRREGRAALRTPWPWAGLAVALAVFAPNLVWNAAHGWVSYAKQGGRVTHFAGARAAQFLGELLAGQLALITPVIFGLAVAGTWRLRGRRDAAARLLLWLILLPAAVFLEHAISGRVQANWPAILIPAAALAAASLPAAVLRRWLAAALASGFALTALVYVQTVAAPVPIAAAADPTALQLAGWAGFARQVAAYPARFYTSDEYGPAAELAFALPRSDVVAGFGGGFDRRWDFLTLKPADLAGTTGILITRRTDTPCPALLGTVTRRRDGQAIMTYRLCRFTAPSGGFILPHP